jgi:hypothetical protein
MDGLSGFGDKKIPTVCGDALLFGWLGRCWTGRLKRRPQKEAFVTAGVKNQNSGFLIPRILT